MPTLGEACSALFDNQTGTNDHPTLWTSPSVDDEAHRRRSLVILEDGSAARTTVLSRVVARAAFPVLVARPWRGTGHVLAVTDLSDPTFPAIRAGAEASRRKNSSLSVLHCIWSTAPAGDPLGPGVVLPTPVPSDAASATAEAARARTHVENLAAGEITEQLIAVTPARSSSSRFAPSKNSDRDRSWGSRPGAHATVPCLEQLTDGHGRVDQADVGIRLREVAEQRSRPRLDIFGEEPDGIGVLEKPLEQ